VSGGAKNETDFIQKIKAETRGRLILAVGLNLDTIMALLQNAAIFMGLDSLVGHMAAALKVPVVGIFGPSREKHWAPHGPEVLIAHVDRACRSCVKGGCLGDNLSACLEELDFGTYVRPLVDKIISPKVLNTVTEAIN
jgi:heptosyltransferase-3